LGGRGRQISEFEASLVYRVSSRTARVHKKTQSQKKKWGAELSREFSKVKKLNEKPSYKWLKNTKKFSTSLVIKEMQI
jgi:hypothetical protein